MQRVITPLTDKEQAFVEPIGVINVPTHWASFAGVVRIYLDRQAPREKRFILDHMVQLSEGPLGVHGVGLALLSGCLLATLAFGALFDTCQMFQADHRTRILLDDPFGDLMIGVLLQPSLSPAQCHKATCCGASAFLLQTLSQSRIVVGSGNYPLTRMEGTVSFSGCSYR
jgi:hypothetical protein